MAGGGLNWNALSSDGDERGSARRFGAGAVPSGAICLRGCEPKPVLLVENRMIIGF